MQLVSFFADCVVTKLLVEQLVDVAVRRNRLVGHDTARLMVCKGLKRIVDLLFFGLPEV